MSIYHTSKQLTWFKIRSIRDTFRSIYRSREVRKVGSRSVEALNQEEGNEKVDKNKREWFDSVEVKKKANIHLLAKEN